MRINFRKYRVVRSILAVIIVLSFLTGCITPITEPIAAETDESGFDSGVNESSHLAQTILNANQLAELLMEQTSIPGMAVAIVDVQEGFSWIQGFGYADVENNVPVDGDTIFGLASISKTFTAIAVMQLVEAGVIDLDEPLITYLPDFYVPADVLTGNGDYHNITVRMLLSHASGIQQDFAGFGVLTANAYESEYMNSFIDNLSSFPMITSESSTFAYSNNAFTLLGILVAEMAGYDDAFQGYASYASQNIFEPLGMGNSTFIINENHVSGLAMPYTDAVNRAEMVFFNGLPAGGLFSTANDMSRYMSAILGGGEYNGGQILSADTLELMFTEQSLESGTEMNFLLPNMHPGLGFYKSDYYDGFSYWGHGGNLPYYQSGIAFDFETGIGIFATANSTTAIQALSLLPVSLLEIAIYEKTGVLNTPASGPKAYPVERSAQELEAFTGTYYLQGGFEFGKVYVKDGELYLYLGVQSGGAYTLHPMSDGSFLLPQAGVRLWFEEMDGKLVIFQGEFKSILLAIRLDEETIMAAEGFDRWVGTYYPELEENWVSTITKITIGIDEDGFAFALTESIMGIKSITGLVQWDDNNFSSIIFNTDGNDTWLEVSGLRFIRQE